MIGGFYVHRRDIVRQQHNLVGVYLFPILAPQVSAPNKAALYQPRYESSRSRERVYHVDALVTERRAELFVQDVFHAADDVVHYLDRRIDDAQVFRGLRQGFCQKALVQLYDYALFACRRGHAFRADPHVAVESLQPFGFLFQPSVLQCVYDALHGARNGVEVGKGVVVEQRVEHRL